MLGGPDWKQMGVYLPLPGGYNGNPCQWILFAFLGLAVVLPFANKISLGNTK